MSPNSDTAVHRLQISPITSEPRTATTTRKRKNEKEGQTPVWTGLVSTRSYHSTSELLVLSGLHHVRSQFPFSISLWVWVHMRRN